MIKILIFFSIIGLCIYFFFGNKISKEYKKYFIIFFIVAIGLLLIFSGKLNFLPVALAPALLFFRRISSLLSLFNLFSRSSFGSKIKPKIKTKYLNIEISGSNYLKESQKSKLSFYEISKDVNKPTNNNISLIQPI